MQAHRTGDRKLHHVTAPPRPRFHAAVIRRTWPGALHAIRRRSVGSEGSLHRTIKDVPGVIHNGKTYNCRVLAYTGAEHLDFVCRAKLKTSSAVLEANGDYVSVAHCALQATAK